MKKKNSKANPLSIYKVLKILLTKTEKDKLNQR